MRSVPRALQAWPSQRRAFFAHPGEVAAAEAAAAIAQRAALRALPAEALGRVDIVASVCTDVPSFLHSQPTLTALAGAAPARRAAGRAGGDGPCPAKQCSLAAATPRRPGSSSGMLSIGHASCPRSRSALWPASSWGTLVVRLGSARTWQRCLRVYGAPRLVRRRLGGAGGRVRLHARCYLWREGLLLDAGQFGRPQARARSPLTRP